MTTRILIVDDDDLNLKILEEILADADFETVRAHDGMEALECLERDSSIKAILLDRMMPNLGGMEVMEKIRNHPEWSKKPVIMQTAATSPDAIIEGASAGVYYYLTKPYQEKMVLSVLRSALQHAESGR